MVYGPSHRLAVRGLLCAVVVTGALAAEARLLAQARGAPAAAAKAVQVSAQAPAVGPALRRLTAGIDLQAASIRGNAWYADNTPIPNARLRLRNVKSGKIAATTTANELGQFVFDNVGTGAYMVELVDENGRVLTVGHTFTAQAGETVATSVRMTVRVPWFAGFFGNAAAAVAATAAATGITALAPDAIRCVSNCG